MLYLLLSILIQVALVIHVLRTGRNMLWILVIALLPLVGTLAYLIVEILPEFLRGRTARRAVSNVKRTLDPTRDLRDAHRQVRITGSIDSRRRFADELFNNGKYREAIEQYRAALTGLYEYDPLLLLGVAKAQFALDEFSNARQTLDTLIKENPDFKSPEGHLLYARALDAEGNKEQARKEYEALVKYYPGAEARYRYAVLLRELGEAAQARELLQLLMTDAELAGKHFRKEQREWLALAKRELDQI